MLRRFVAACVVFVMCIGVIFAAEIKGKVTKVENEGKKKIIYVKVEGKEKDTKVNVGKKTKIVDADGKEVDIKDVKEGAEIVATYEEKDNPKDNTKKLKVYSEIKIKK